MVKLSVNPGIVGVRGEKKGRRKREGEGGERGLVGGDEASGSSWGMQRTEGMPGFSRACGSANRASGPPAIVMATPGLRRLRNGGNPIKRRDAAPGGKVWGRNEVAFGSKAGERVGPKVRSVRKGLLSLFALLITR